MFSLDCRTHTSTDETTNKRADSKALIITITTSNKAPNETTFKHTHVIAFAAPFHYISILPADLSP